MRQFTEYFMNENFQIIDWESHEIKGIDLKMIPILENIDIWIPDDIRLKYEDWIEEQYWD